MGAGRSIGRGSEEQMALDGNQYRYPPPAGGNYFGTHYHLGRRRFPTGEPEQFLFGELGDINLLNPNPVIYPYKPRGKSQPVRCLRSHIYVQRDSVKLVRAEIGMNAYSIEFVYDSEVDCQFTIYHNLPDTTTLQSLCGSPQLGSSPSPCIQQSLGSERPFKEKSYTFSPAHLNPNLLVYDPDNGQTTFPVSIFMETAGSDNNHQALLTICNLDRTGESTFNIKVLKQKLLVDGVEYLLQEFYGLENKAKQVKGTPEPSEGEENSDLGAECVVCITDVRDTLLLPCRHLCLCSSCAANLRYQSNNCPICRSPFQALLHIQALVPLKPDEAIADDDLTGNPEYAHPGYRTMSLLQALNGYPSNPQVTIQTEVVENDEELEVPVGPEETENSTVGSQEGFAMETLSRSCPVVLPVEPLSYLPIVDIPQTRPQRPPVSSHYLAAPCFSEDALPLPGTPVSDSYPQQVVVVLEGEGEEQAENNNLGNNQVSPEGGDSCYSSQSSVNSDGSVRSRDALLSAKGAELSGSRESK